MGPPPALGKFLRALGVIGLIRLIPEILAFSPVKYAYALMVTMDAVLALGTGVAGEGIRRGRDWAPKLALRTAGIVVPTSIGMGMLLVRVFQEFGLEGHLLARSVYYLLAVGFWPYGVWTLIARAPAESRTGLLANLFFSLLIGVPLGVYLNSALR